MDIEIIKQIAEETGIDLYGPMQLVTAEDGKTFKFARSREITIFGKKLIRFANLIESRLKQQEKNNNANELGEILRRDQETT